MARKKYIFNRDDEVQIYVSWQTAPIVGKFRGLDDGPIIYVQNEHGVHAVMGAHLMTKKTEVK